MKAGKQIVAEDEYSYPLHMSGYGTTLPDDDGECEAVRLLHEAVQIVTGRPVERKEKPRMGFLP